MVGQTATAHTRDQPPPVQSQQRMNAIRLVPARTATAYWAWACHRSLIPASRRARAWYPEMAMTPISPRATQKTTSDTLPSPPALLVTACHIAAPTNAISSTIPSSTAAPVPIEVTHHRSWEKALTLSTMGGSPRSTAPPSSGGMDLFSFSSVAAAAGSSTRTSSGPSGPSAGALIVHCPLTTNASADRRVMLFPTVLVG